MNFKHFCHICNVNFHRAIDFITHKHKDIKPVIEPFTPDSDAKYWNDGR